MIDMDAELIAQGPVECRVSRRPCPECGCPSELALDSNANAEASWMECGWCEYRFQARCDEETLVERWNKISRKKMPVFVEHDD